MKTKFTQKAYSVLAFMLCLPSVAMASSPSLAASEAGPVITSNTLEVQGLSGIKPDVAPRKVIAEKPEYPFHAKAIGREGWVIVELDIDDKGVPLNAEIVDSGPSPLFRRATLNAVKKFRFDPAT